MNDSSVQGTERISLIIGELRGPLMKYWMMQNHGLRNHLLFDVNFSDLGAIFLPT